jgi:hypothetical protein
LDTRRLPEEEEKEEEGEWPGEKRGRKKKMIEASEDSMGRPPAYFCLICFQGFQSSEMLETHIKSHKELEVEESCCRMLAQPAGVI